MTSFHHITEQIEVIIDHNGSYEPIFNLLLKWIPKADAIVFYGQLGAGKTTLIKQFARECFEVSEMSSPTYAIIHLHPCTPNLGITEIAHMDLYRLNNSDEFVEIGGEDYLENKNTLPLIEWPEYAIPFLSEYIKVEILIQEDGSRKLILSLVAIKKKE